MVLRQNFLFFLTATLLTLLPSQLSFAFNIKGPLFYSYSVPYYIDRQLGIRGRTRLDAWPELDPRRILYRGKVLEIKQGGTDKLINLLENTFPDWNFEQKGNLEGSFDIQEYYACTPNYPLPGIGGCGGLINSRIGAQFKLNYTPKGSDPTGDKVHWIQRIIGIINLAVQAANGGRRGEDKGNYELYIELYDEDDGEPLPPEIIVGSSGGGGVVLERPRPGGTQQNPILPTSNSGDWQVFHNVPSCRWYDPHTTHGFEFQALENTLFTEILDFPVGLDNRFTVSVGDTILGEFSPGDSVDFVSLFGAGVSDFKITDIDTLIGDTEATAFPIQLAFNQSVGSFQMRAIEATPEPRHIPEPTAILGLFMLGGWGVFQGYKIKKGK